MPRRAPSQLTFLCATASALAGCSIARDHFFRDAGDDAGVPSDADAPTGVPPDRPPNARIGFQAYVKASNTDAGDAFGTSVALSANGTTLAVGAFHENSGNHSEADNNADDAGAVYVFTYDGAIWVKQAYVKADHPDQDDQFGASVALSADGSTLAVGAPTEDGNARTINGDQTNNDAPAAGAAYVFRRSGGAWTQEAYIKPSNLDDYDAFGTSVSLSADGATLAVGAPGESGNGTGPGDNSQMSAGAAYVFTFDGSTWGREHYVKPSVPVGMIQLGATVALSGDGSHLAVGVSGLASYGEVYVFARSGAAWNEQLHYQSADANTGFGSSVALSREGSVLAVGAAGDSLDAPGGAVFTFTRSGTVWSARSTALAPDNTGPGDNFGYSLSLSDDGSLLAVGANLEDGNGKGVDGDPTDNHQLDAGAVYVFTRSGAAWAQQTYVKACNTAAGSQLGASVALSPDGTTLAAGAVDEDSSAKGVTMGPGGTDTGAADAGAVYIYR
jgi:hypothetical protein